MAAPAERDVTMADGRIVGTAALGASQGFPVIWHHGNPGSGVPPVSENVLRDAGVLLISYDRPGGGRSDSLPGRRIASSGPDIAAIADAWEIDRFGTAGFSGGGSFALATAAQLGDRVLAAAVLSGAAPIDASNLDFFAGMTDTSVGPTDDARDKQGRAQRLLDMEPTRQAILTDPYEALMGFVEEWPDSDRDALQNQEIAIPLAEGMAECVRVSAEGWLDDSVAFHRPWGFDLTGITAPVSIWHGRDDTAAPIDHGRWLAHEIPGSRLHELDGAHYAAYPAIPDVLRWIASHA